ncbi:MAG: hypothetical protein H0W63_07265 [Gemmatimonadaceae bacterium]|nr:hypothetical protein [Gemmatimonadaceae bacterium]
MLEPLNPRRVAFGAAKKLIFNDRDPEQMLQELAGLRPSSNPTEPRQDMSRPRKDILTNIDEMYREAFERAKATGDEAQLVSLDFAYRREQLYFEILLDVREALERK